jgi:hypothetical protein
MYLPLLVWLTRRELGSSSAPSGCFFRRPLDCLGAADATGILVRQCCLSLGDDRSALTNLMTLCYNRPAVTRNCAPELGPSGRDTELCARAWEPLGAQETSLSLRVAGVRKYINR